jgi:hypothetical protein
MSDQQHQQSWITLLDLCKWSISQEQCLSIFVDLIGSSICRVLSVANTPTQFARTNEKSLTRHHHEQLTNQKSSRDINVHEQIFSSRLPSNFFNQATSTNIHEQLASLIYLLDLSISSGFEPPSFVVVVT